MFDINRDWDISRDKPAMNSWYPCKRGDDYWKIILQQRCVSPVYGSKTSFSLYRVVSMRGADIAFDLTLPMARALLMKETRRYK